MNLISIITCMKDDNPEWELTYNSIRSHLNENLNWLIKFSQNCSEQFISSIPESPFIKKVASADVSLYDAINQALANCSSNFYFTLGSGDILLEENIPVFIDEVAKNPNHDAYFFATIVKTSGFSLIPDPTQINIRMSCPHPSALLSVEKSIQIGGYSDQYEIASDYEHLVKYCKRYNKFYVSSTPAVEFMGGGMSSIRSLEGLLEEELIRIRLHNSNLLAVHGRILQRSATVICNVITSNFN